MGQSVSLFWCSRTALIQLYYSVEPHFHRAMSPSAVRCHRKVQFKQPEGPTLTLRNILCGCEPDLHFAKSSHHVVQLQTNRRETEFRLWEWVFFILYSWRSSLKDTVSVYSLFALSLFSVATVLLPLMDYFCGGDLQGDQSRLFHKTPQSKDAVILFYRKRTKTGTKKICKALVL